MFLWRLCITVLYFIAVLSYCLFYFIDFYRIESHFLSETHTQDTFPVYTATCDFIYFSDVIIRNINRSRAASQCAALWSLCDQSRSFARQSESVFFWFFFFFFHCDTEDCKRPSRAVEHLLKKKNSSNNNNNNNNTSHSFPVYMRHHWGN